MKDRFLFSLKIIVTPIVLGMFLQFSFAQNLNIDSLKQISGKAQEDTNNVNALNEIVNVFKKNNLTDSVLLYSKKAVRLAQKINFNKGEARALSNCGNVYYAGGNYPEALKYYLAALKIAEGIKNKLLIAQINNNLGNVYNYLGNYIKAAEYLKVAIKNKHDLGDKRGELVSRSGLGIAYGNLKNYKEAMAIFSEVIDEAIKSGFEFVAALAYTNSGVYDAKMGNYNKALTDHQKAHEIYIKLNEKHSIGISYANKSDCYIHLHKYKEAEENALEGLKYAVEINDLEGLRECYEFLSIIYEKTNNHSKALFYYKKFITAKDSLSNEENTKKTVRLEMNYEFEKKEDSTKLEQEKKEAVAMAESRKQKIIIWSVCGILILVFAFAIFAYRSYRHKQKANEAITKQKEIIEEKQKEILDSIHYAKRIQIALLPHEKYIERTLNKLK